MGRKATVDEADLLCRLSKVFRDVGYEAATLTMLAQATGLQKASLYHRFPNGKEQMAREVLLDAGARLEEKVLAPLKGEGLPKTRLTILARRLDEFYSGGRQACLLNMLSTNHTAKGPYAELIKKVFEAWVATLAGVLVEAGLDKKVAARRAERSVVMLQGSLVYARGTGSTRPFKEYIKGLPDELLEGV